MSKKIRADGGGVRDQPARRDAVDNQADGEVDEDACDEVGEQVSVHACCTSWK